MKYSTAIKRITNALLLASTMILGGCSSIHANTGSPTASTPICTTEEAEGKGQRDSSAKPTSADSTSSSAIPTAAPTGSTALAAGTETETVPSFANPSETDSEAIPYTYVFTADDIPEWNGEPYTVINDNIPYFPDDYYMFP